MLEHRYDPFEIYSDEFEDELKSIPDPKKEPIECIDQFLSVLDEFGPWCADRAALNLIAQIEKSKIKTPYERHYLLLCLVSTTLIEIRAFCEQIFQRIPNDKTCIQTYSSPKALRLLNILRQFKPEKSTEELKECDLTVEKNTIRVDDVKNVLSNVSVQCNGGQQNYEITTVKTTHDKQLNSAVATKATQKFNISKKSKGIFTRQRANHSHQNDPNALCGLLLCNSMFTAKILFSFIYEMTKKDTDLEYLSVQYTGDRLADPVTESKQFENEHRKQEEVLKRFRMHSCNLLIGTSVLEEGIELPKCNLVIRWNLPTTYRSYVQCKGRARAQKAFHIIMVSANKMHYSSTCNEFLLNKNHKALCSNAHTENVQCFDRTEFKQSLDEGTNPSDNENEDENAYEKLELSGEEILQVMENETEHIVKLLAQYMQIEQILLKKCSNQEPSLHELADADLYTNYIKPYKPNKSDDSNTPFVSLATAVVLVNKYCAKLPSDTFTKLTPIWRCCKTYRKNKVYYQYTVRLPINSPVKQDIYVSIFKLCRSKIIQIIVNSQYEYIYRVFQCQAKCSQDKWLH